MHNFKAHCLMASEELHRLKNELKAKVGVREQVRKLLTGAVDSADALNTTFVPKTELRSIAQERHRTAKQSQSWGSSLFSRIGVGGPTQETPEAVCVSLGGSMQRVVQTKAYRAVQSQILIAENFVLWSKLAALHIVTSPVNVNRQLYGQHDNIPSKLCEALLTNPTLKEALKDFDPPGDSSFAHLQDIMRALFFDSKHTGHGTYGKELSVKNIESALMQPSLDSATEFTKFNANIANASIKIIDSDVLMKAVNGTQDLMVDFAASAQYAADGDIPFPIPSEIRHAQWPREKYGKRVFRKGMSSKARGVLKTVAGKRTDRTKPHTWDSQLALSKLNDALYKASQTADGMIKAQTYIGARCLALIGSDMMTAFGTFLKKNPSYDRMTYVGRSLLGFIKSRYSHIVSSIYVMLCVQQFFSVPIVIDTAVAAQAFDIVANMVDARLNRPIGSEGSVQMYQRHDMSSKSTQMTRLGNTVAGGNSVDEVCVVDDTPDELKALKSVQDLRPEHVVDTMTSFLYFMFKPLLGRIVNLSVQIEMLVNLNKALTEGAFVNMTPCAIRLCAAKELVSPGSESLPQCALYKTFVNGLASTLRMAIGDANMTRIDKNRAAIGTALQISEDKFAAMQTAIQNAGLLVAATGDDAKRVDQSNLQRLSEQLKMVGVSLNASAEGYDVQALTGNPGGLGDLKHKLGLDGAPLDVVSDEGDAVGVRTGVPTGVEESKQAPGETDDEKAAREAAEEAASLEAAAEQARKDSIEDAKRAADAAAALAAKHKAAEEKRVAAENAAMLSAAQKSLSTLQPAQLNTRIHQVNLKKVVRKAKKEKTVTGRTRNLWVGTAKQKLSNLAINLSMNGSARFLIGGNRIPVSVAKDTLVKIVQKSFVDDTNGAASEVLLLNLDRFVSAGAGESDDEPLFPKSSDGENPEAAWKMCDVLAVHRYGSLSQQSISSLRDVAQLLLDEEIEVISVIDHKDFDPSKLTLQSLALYYIFQPIRTKFGDRMTVDKQLGEAMMFSLAMIEGGCADSTVDKVARTISAVQGATAKVHRILGSRLGSEFMQNTRIGLIQHFKALFNTVKGDKKYAELTSNDRAVVDSNVQKVEFRLYGIDKVDDTATVSPEYFSLPGQFPSLKRQYDGVFGKAVEVNTLFEGMVDESPPKELRPEAAKDIFVKEASLLDFFVQRAVAVCGITTFKSTLSELVEACKKFLIESENNHALLFQTLTSAMHTCIDELTQLRKSTTDGFVLSAAEKSGVAVVVKDASRNPKLYFKDDMNDDEFKKTIAEQLTTLRDASGTSDEMKEYLQTRFVALKTMSRENFVIACDIANKIDVVDDEPPAANTDSQKDTAAYTLPFDLQKDTAAVVDAILALHKKAAANPVFAETVPERALKFAARVASKHLPQHAKEGTVIMHAQNNGFEFRQPFVINADPVTEAGRVMEEFQALVKMGEDDTAFAAANKKAIAAAMSAVLMNKKGVPVGAAVQMALRSSPENGLRFVNDPRSVKGGEDPAEFELPDTFEGTMLIAMSRALQRLKDTLRRVLFVDVQNALKPHLRRIFRSPGDIDKPLTLEVWYKYFKDTLTEGTLPPWLTADDRKQYTGMESTSELWQPMIASLATKYMLHLLATQFDSVLQFDGLKRLRRTVTQISEVQGNSALMLRWKNGLEENGLEDVDWKTLALESAASAHSTPPEPPSVPPPEPPSVPPPEPRKKRQGYDGLRDYLAEMRN